MSHDCDSGEQCACVLALDTALRPCLTHVSMRSAVSRGLKSPASWRRRRLLCERDPEPKCRHGVGRVAAGGSERGVAYALRAAASEARHSAVARSRLSRRLSVSCRYHIIVVSHTNWTIRDTGFSYCFVAVTAQFSMRITVR